VVGTYHHKGQGSLGKELQPMCPHTPEDYSPEQEVRKLRMKQEEEASGRREQAQRRIREKEEEASGRREEAQHWMRGGRSP
jgi:hypothetical protein